MARNLETRLTFTDLKTAYDSISLNRLWNAMSKNGVNDLNEHAVKNLYTNMTNCINLRTKLSREFPICRGLRQSFVIAPTMLKIYLKSALKHWKHSCWSMGIDVRKDTPFMLHFVVNHFTFAEDEDDISYTVRKVTEKYKKWSLLINMKKICNPGKYKKGVYSRTGSYKRCQLLQILGTITRNKIKNLIRHGKQTTNQENGAQI